MADLVDSEHDRFSGLYAEHYAAVLRYAARRVGAEAARDIAAETFMTAWRRLDRVPPAQPLPWLYATARRYVANELRRKDHQNRLDSRLRTEATRGPEAASPELSERLADRLDVLAALITLHPKDQEALRLIEWEQLDIAAGAAALGCSAGALATPSKTTLLSPSSTAGWPGGISPPGSHRTERDSLPSLRSSHL